VSIISALRGRGSPYTSFSHSIPNRPRNILQQARYQIVPGSHGVPVAQVELDVARTVPGTPNPDMAFAMVIDRSGSMTGTFNDGHVSNAATAVFNNLTGGRGLTADVNLAFYDTSPTFVGLVSTLTGLQRSIAVNAPRNGGTRLAETLRGVIDRYRGGKRGIYVIVITDGEFADKVAVERLVLNEIVPQLTPENPNAVRLHFIGAGEEVDREFLERLESEAAARGVALVRQHHHAHLSHAHASMVDEMDAVYVGLGRDIRIAAPDGALLRAAQLQSPIGGTAQGLAPVWHEGHVFETAFLPRRSILAFEYASPHTGSLPLTISYTGADGGARSFPLAVPLPEADRRGRGGAARSTSGGGRAGLLGGVLHRRTPEERAAADEAARQAAQAREAELARQHADAVALRRGGIPTSARARLRELREDPGAFTSDLAPDEIALLRRGGYQARGLVTGSAMYHVGQAYASSTQDCEVAALSSAYNEATRLAVSRMEQEVRELGAFGAVGVRYTVVRHEWADRTIEVRIVGTAVSGSGRPPEHPWLSDLSGQEWWALQRAGYEAAGLVYGHCTWFVLTTPADEMIKNSFQNIEFQHQSMGLAQARGIALRHMLQQARGVGAHGVAGVSIAHRLDEVRLTGPGENPVYEYEHHNIVLSIIGTAIRLRPDAPRAVRQTVPILSLRDGRMVPATVHAPDVSLE
jgi:uncharacterized protein YbjQ (UPF0145 family)